VASRLIAKCQSVDRAWFCIELTRYLKRTLFNQYSRKYIKITHRLVGHLYTYILWCLLRWLATGSRGRCREGVVICFPVIAWQSWFRRNRHFAFYQCITYQGDGTLYLHVRCPTLAFCTCDSITTGRSRVITKFSSRFQTKTSRPPLP